MALRQTLEGARERLEDKGIIFYVFYFVPSLKAKKDESPLMARLKNAKI